MTRDLAFGEGDAVVLVDGRSAFRELPGDSPDRTVHLHGEWLDPGLEAALARGELEDGYGRFVAVVHDRAARRLSIHNDRYGMVPLFRAEADGRLYLSVRLKPLLERGASQRSLDRAALSEVLAFHTPLGRRTLVRDVETVPPATRLTIDLAGPEPRVVEERRWEPAAVLAGEQVSYESLCDDLVASFLEGYERCIDGEPRVGITLSGGIDSRCLLAVGLAKGASLSAFNASVPGSRSARYAERMAGLSSTPYAAHGVGADFAKGYGARLLGVIELTEGMTFASEVEAYWLREHVEGPTVMLHGAFGELSKLVKMHLYEVMGAVASAQRPELPDVLFARFEPAYLSNLAVFSEALRNELSDLAHAGLKSEIEAIDGSLSVPQVMQVLYLKEFLSKVTRCSAAVWNDRLPTRFPFAYPPLVDTLLRVRSEEKIRQRFQLDLLRRTSPELFAFPDANTGARADAPGWLVAALGFADKVRTVMTSSKTTLDHADRLTWFMGMEPSAAEILFDPSAEDVFDRAALQASLDLVLGESGSPGFGPVAAVRHRIARHRAATTIQKALQFQLWRGYSGITGL